MKILPVNFKILNKTRKSSNPISFKGFECREDSFEVKRVYNLPCPVCGRRMIQQNQIDSFVAGCQSATGDALSNLLSKYRGYFHDTEQSVAGILTCEASLHPEANILELASQYTQKYIKQMKIEQLDSIGKIPQMAGKLASSQKNLLESLVQKYSYIVQNEPEKFDKTELENEINKILSGSYQGKKRLMKMIKKIPTVNDPEYKFLKRYGEKTIAELASKLLTPSLATCEHIRPKSAGGKNNTENYLAQCQECNSTRNDIPFANWISGKAGFMDNLMKYLRAVAGKIETGEISSDYVDYPSDITRTISVETNGKTRLEAPIIELSKDAVKLNFEAKITQLKKSIEILKTELRGAKQIQAKTKNSNQFRLYLEYVELEKEKTSLTAKKQGLMQTQTRLKKVIDGYYRNVIELRELQKNIGNVSGQKEIEKARNKIASLQRYISSIKIEEQEAQADETNVEIANIALRLNAIDYKMQALFPKINFSSQYQSMINDVKVQIFELRQLLDKVAEKSKIEAQIKEYETLARQKETRIKELNDINANLNPNDEDGQNIEEYKKMGYIISRSDDLKDKLQKLLGKDFLDIDLRIFEFAKTMASDSREELIEKSNAVKHYTNLEEIEKLTQELKSIYVSIEQLKARLKEFEAIQKQISTMKTMEELNRELTTLNIQLAGAKEVEASVDIEQKIQALEEEIERKTKILEKIENKEISEEEFIRIISEV